MVLSVILTLKKGKNISSIPKFKSEQCNMTKETPAPTLPSAHFRLLLESGPTVTRHGGHRGGCITNH